MPFTNNVGSVSSASDVQGVFHISGINDPWPLVAVIIVLLYFAIQLFITITLLQNKSRVHRLVIMNRIPVPPPPVFSGPEHATAVHLFANKEYFQHLLAVLEEGLLSEGYELSRHANAQRRLEPEIFSRLARKLFIAREKYMAPLQSDSSLAEKYEDYNKDGYPAAWLQTLIDGSAAQGWYIAHPDVALGTKTSWEAHVYPLKQVVITITAGKTALPRDIRRCLSEASRMAQDMSFSPNDKGTSCSGVTEDELQYTILHRQCFNPAGFFPDAAGDNVPATLIAGLNAASPSWRRLTVFVQGTQSMTAQGLAYYIEVAGKRFSSGEKRGALYDDNAGYAFILETASL